MENRYKVLRKQVSSSGNYSILPIRMEDRYVIMKWRNEQIYHLRQNKPLSNEDQDKYFNTVIASLFAQEKPSQILFSYMEDDKCIGYGGLVHINWIDHHAEISFIMDTELERNFFAFHWTTFLGLIEDVAFNELSFHKICTYAYDIRPRLYSVLEKAGFNDKVVLKEHCLYEGKYLNVVIHSKIFNKLSLRNINNLDVNLIYKWATDPLVRQYSFSQEKIEWDVHQKWFSNKINESNCEYFILIDNQQEIGSIRFDIDDLDQAMVSYLIDPLFHRRGYGKIILEKGIERLITRRPNVKIIYGFVKKENAASIKIFKNLGFQEISDNSTVCKFEKMI